MELIWLFHIFGLGHQVAVFVNEILFSIEMQLVNL